VAKAELTRIYTVLVSRTWPQSHTLSHTALYRQRSRVTGRRLGLRPQGRASKRAARTRTQYTSSAVRRVCSAGAQWFRHSPVAHRLASASPDRPLLNSPLPLYHFRACRRVEVGRDRHTQKAGNGGRAVAIDSAPVTRAQNKKAASYTRSVLKAVIRRSSHVIRLRISPAHRRKCSHLRT